MRARRNTDKQKRVNKSGSAKISPIEIEPKNVQIVKFVGDKKMEIMNMVEKRDFIHSHLHQADEKVIDEFYETLRKGEILRKKLTSRAEKSESDIHSGNVFSRTELEQRTNNIGR